MTTAAELRDALAARAQTIDVPAPPPVRLLRQRVLVDRLRAATTVAIVLLLVTGATAVALRPSSSPSTVDTRFGAPASGPTTTAATANSTAPPANGPSGALPTKAPAAGGSTTTTLPGHAGPIQISNSPPTSRGPGEPTFAVAQPGTWFYRIVARRSDHTAPLVGSDTGEDTFPDASFDARPPTGRTQKLRAGQLPYVTVRDATRTLADAVTIHDLVLWDGRDDTQRTFRLPAGAFEVPAKADWGRPWGYEATSTDGTTHLRVQSKVGDGRDVVWLEDGSSTSYYAVRVDSVLDVSGDRTSHIERSVWWATDLGVPAQIREVERTTTSSGTTYWRDVKVTLRQTTASPESVNQQVAPDEDQDGVPDSADNTPSG